jgi:hypothetical protein
LVFERYYFEDPRDQTRWVKVGHGSYVAAALIGSVYVLWKAGAGAFVSALPAHLLLSGTLVALTAVTSIALPETQQLLALIVAVPAILTVQSLMMIQVIHKSYRRRGWLVDTVV